MGNIQCDHKRFQPTWPICPNTLNVTRGQIPLRRQSNIYTLMLHEIAVYITDQFLHFMLHFMVMLFHIRFVWKVPPMASDPASLMTFKVSIANRKSEHARCVAYVPGRIWSRRLDFICKISNLYFYYIIRFGKAPHQFQGSLQQLRVQRMVTKQQLVFCVRLFQ